MLSVAFRLLATEGPQEVTPVRIHTETGIARTTVYRHWPTPTHLITEILETAIARNELEALTGELDHDLRVAVSSLTFRFENRPVRAFLRATLQAPEDEDEPAQATPLSERYITGLIAPVRDVVGSAVDRSELDGDPDQMTSTLCGPLILDHVLLDRPVDHDTIEARISDFLRLNRR